MIATETSATDQDILDWAAWSWEYGFGADTTRVNDLLRTVVNTTTTTTKTK